MSEIVTIEDAKEFMKGKSNNDISALMNGLLKVWETKDPPILGDLLSENQFWQKHLSLDGKTYLNHQKICCGTNAVLNINLIGLNPWLNARTYFCRYKNLYEDLKKKPCYTPLELMYNIFNPINELAWLGTKWEQLVNLETSHATLYRFSGNVDSDDNKVKNEIDKLNSEDKTNLLYRAVRDAVAQVNGTEEEKLKLPSFSKSLGIVLFKYAHKGGVIRVRKDEQLNCFNRTTSFHKLFFCESKEKITEFCLDLSEDTATKKTLDSLNQWLTIWAQNEGEGRVKKINTLSSPLKDQHVIAVVSSKSHEVQLSINNEMELCWILCEYAKRVCCENNKKPITALQAEIGNNMDSHIDEVKHKADIMLESVGSEDSQKKEREKERKYLKDRFPSATDYGGSAYDKGINIKGLKIDNQEFKTVYNIKAYLLGMI